MPYTSTIDVKDAYLTDNLPMLVSKALAGKTLLVSCEFDSLGFYYSVLTYLEQDKHPEFGTEAHFRTRSWIDMVPVAQGFLRSGGGDIVYAPKGRVAHTLAQHALENDEANAITEAALLLHEDHLAHLKAHPNMDAQVLDAIERGSKEVEQWRAQLEAEFAAADAESGSSEKPVLH